jgi:hypothetical protein
VPFAAIFPVEPTTLLLLLLLPPRAHLFSPCLTHRPSPGHRTEESGPTSSIVQRLHDMTAGCKHSSQPKIQPDPLLHRMTRVASEALRGVDYPKWHVHDAEIPSPTPMPAPKGLLIVLGACGEPIRRLLDSPEIVTTTSRS